ncbi:MAG: putative lipid II flippase FtsW [Actinobacteria bacterium]|nr:putative lipid II flippase FtsW [Actinomycetota bacterium]NCY10493.1 putative lipid II flippase FtsW [Actinomycetota bacterium]
MNRSRPLFATPASAYYLILGSVVALSSLGLVMVLSASSVKSLRESGNSFSFVLRQALFLILAAGLAWVAMKLRYELWKPIAQVSLILSCALLVLPQIGGIGKTVGGNTNWIGIGSFTLQPSEFAKLGLILWCALRLRIHDEKASQGIASNPATLVVPGFMLVMALILLGRDLGTAVLVTGIVAGILFISGLAFRVFGLLAGGAGLLFAAFILPNANRMNRFSSFFDPFAEQNYQGVGWQQAHSIMGLASGGAVGTGLGSSKQKWGSLPEVHTDFIFAVIGEELGLLGTLATLGLFAILILGIFKVAINAQNSFDRYICAGIGCWISLQVLLNIGTVISLIPVVGVTLPLISYGGSSLLATFIALGYVLGVLRRDPQIASEIRQRKAARTARG